MVRVRGIGDGDSWSFIIPSSRTEFKLNLYGGKLTVHIFPHRSVRFGFVLCVARKL